MTNVYAIILDENGVPSLKPLAVAGAASIGGVDYLLVPAEPFGVFRPHPAAALEPDPDLKAKVKLLKANMVKAGTDEEYPTGTGREKNEESEETRETAEPETFDDDLSRHIVAAYKRGALSPAQIAREVHAPTTTISAILRRYGLKTSAELARERITEYLEAMGEKGAGPHQLDRIAQEVGSRHGPIMQVMQRQGIVSKMANGKWRRIAT